MFHKKGIEESSKYLLSKKIGGTIKIGSMS